MLLIPSAKTNRIVTSQLKCEETSNLLSNKSRLANSDHEKYVLVNYVIGPRSPEQLTTAPTSGSDHDWPLTLGTRNDAILEFVWQGSWWFGGGEGQGEVPGPEFELVV